MLNYELLNELRKGAEHKKRVAAYCRVSTDKEDQANSFESQQRYFKAYIEREPDWELKEIYADEGITGTNTKKRKAFHRMIEACKNGEIDLIVTKEISRFARNTLDSVGYTRELKKIGVGVIFMNDGINTLDPDAELRLTIMSSIAQEESRKTSERVKWGQKQRMEQGVVFGRDLLGYKVRGGKLYIEPEGAKIVRLIFDKFTNENKGTHVIARELREAGIQPMNVRDWSATVILRVIRNEKYCGDLVQKKTYTPDYLSHDKKYNRGQEEFVILRDHHEPIVSREQFDLAQRILNGRAESLQGKDKHSNRYCFSGKIKCGRCGRSFVARYKKRKDGTQYKTWRCFEASRNGSPKEDAQGNAIGCSNDSIRNEDALHIMYLATRQLELDFVGIVANLQAAIEEVLRQDIGWFDCDGMQERISDTEKKKSRLIELYTENLINMEEFVAERKKCDDEICKLRQMMESAEAQQEVNEKKNAILKEIGDTIREIVNGLHYDDEFYREILDRMVVHDREHIDVYLKCLPQKLSFLGKSAALLMDKSGKNGEETSFLPTCDTQIPMSLSVARTRSSGMEKRWVR